MFSWKCESNKQIRNQNAWKQSQQVAYDLLSKDRKDLIDITEGATHFHNKTVRPGWNLKKVAQIDDHAFYK
jgi:spore germination cell wall hydrolase CwlJ-like protein